MRSRERNVQSAYQKSKQESVTKADEDEKGLKGKEAPINFMFKTMVRAQSARGNRHYYLSAKKETRESDSIKKLYQFDHIKELKSRDEKVRMDLK